VTAAGARYLTGERVGLRALHVDDVGERYVAWMNDPMVIRYLESRYEPNSEQRIRDFVTAAERDPNQQLMAIVRLDGEEHIGNIKLGPINWIHRSADIGIIIGERSEWGKGYATDAIGLLTRHAFATLGLHKLSAGCYAANEGSARAFEKAGFRREGLRREQFFSDGAWVDEILLGRTADD
jgi:[ribosomal protein S5]-alanine N-acetyltransferase